MRIAILWKHGDEPVCQDIDFFVGKLSIYSIRTLRGKMQQTFGKDAFVKGYIEFLDYYTLESHKVWNYQELKEMEGN